MPPTGGVRRMPPVISESTRRRRVGDVLPQIPAPRPQAPGGGTGGGGGGGVIPTSGGGVSGWDPIAPPGGFNVPPGLVESPWLGGGQDMTGPNGTNAALQSSSQFMQGPQVTGATPFWQSQGIQAGSDPMGIMAGYQRISGESITQDPAIAAASADFARRGLPMIQNQMALAGLEDTSAAGQAMSDAYGSMLTPLYQDAFGREQHALDRGFQGTENFLNRRYGSVEDEFGRRERSAVRGAEAQQSVIDRLLGLVGQQYGQRAGAVGMGADLGGQFRDVGQSRNEAAYQDMLRQQALSEQGLFLPFGQTAPSALGSRTVTSGGK